MQFAYSSILISTSNIWIHHKCILQYCNYLVRFWLYPMQKFTKIVEWIKLYSCMHLRNSALKRDTFANLPFFTWPKACFLHISVLYSLYIYYHCYHTATVRVSIGVPPSVYWYMCTCIHLILLILLYAIWYFYFQTFFHKI